MDVFDAIAATPALRDACVRAAHDLGLFERLAPAPRTAAELATGRSVHRLEALLDALALEGCLDRTQDAPARFRLVRVPPVPVVPRHGWGLLAEVIRADRPLPEDGVSGTPGEALGRFHSHLAMAGAGAARETVALVADAADHLLDLGAGAGAYSLAFLEQNPRGRATLVDRPAVLDLARAVLPAGRATFAAIDIFSVSDTEATTPSVVMLANILHHFAPDDCARLLRIARARAGPGGLVCVKDVRLDEGHRGPPAGILFSVNMAVFTVAGRVHDTGTLRALFAAAGLSFEERRLVSSPASIVALGRPVTT